jgi:hypothetical protein
MRITIQTEEFAYQAGFFKKEPRWKVKCAIEFSEEEKQIIRRRGLGDVHVYTREFGPGIDSMECNLAHVVKSGIETICLTPVDAKNFEHELKTELLPGLKNYLMASAEVSTAAETFEL